AGAIDHVGHPAGHDAQHRRDAVALAHLTAGIAEQGERQLVLAGEAGVPVGGVRADPDHLGVGVGEHLVAVAEGAGLGRAPARIVPGVEVQDDDPVTEPVGEPDLLAGLRGEREVGRLVPDLNTTCHWSACLLPGPRGDSSPPSSWVNVGTGDHCYTYRSWGSR